MTAQRAPSHVALALVTLVVVYVAVFLPFWRLTLLLSVEHEPFVPVVHERVVFVPPLTVKVTVAPATGWPF